MGMRAIWVVPVIVSILILGVLSSQEAFALIPFFDIIDDSTGGDCQLIGTWDSRTKTCTLTTDLAATQIRFAGVNGITLDGNGHTSIGNGASGTSIEHGVRLFASTNVIVKNLNVQNYDNGIFIGDNSFGNTIVGNTVSDNAIFGIQTLFGANGNTIMDNTLTNNRLAIGLRTIGNTATGNTITGNLVGISISNSDNIVKGNIINSGTVGISLSNGANNVISENLITQMTGHGITITLNPGPHNNQVFNNDFIDNAIQAKDFFGSGTLWNLAAPVGGNYWNNFDEPIEGCEDLNADKFCDSPFIVGLEQDNLPWTTQNGWAVSDTGDDGTGPPSTPGGGSGNSNPPAEPGPPEETPGKGTPPQNPGPPSGSPGSGNGKGKP